MRQLTLAGMSRLSLLDTDARFFPATGHVIEKSRCSDFRLNCPAAIHLIPPDASLHTFSQVGFEMSIIDSGSDITVAANKSSIRVTLSPWVNEPWPPLGDLLSAHDVARLTRRPRWLVHGLALFGRFPRKKCFHGRKVGWLRSDVVGWMARDLELAPSHTAQKADSRSCARRRPLQPCLPLDCMTPCARGQRTGARP